MRLVTALLDWIRAFLGRLRARALLKQRLPRGPTAPALRTALRTPADPAPGEYETVLLGAQIVRGAGPRRLLRLAALPPLLPEFSGVRPDRFRLDGDLRLPHERGAARTAADLPPPAPARGPPRPRTPLPRVPPRRQPGRNSARGRRNRARLAASGVAARGGRAALDGVAATLRRCPARGGMVRLVVGPAQSREAGWSLAEAPPPAGPDRGVDGRGEGADAHPPRRGEGRGAARPCPLQAQPGAAADRRPPGPARHAAGARQNVDRGTAPQTLCPRRQPAELGRLLRMAHPDGRPRRRLSRSGGHGPLGSGADGRQRTSTCSDWTPFAPYPSSFQRGRSGWVRPASSVARQRSTWRPRQGGVQISSQARQA